MAPFLEDYVNQFVPNVFSRFTTHDWFKINLDKKIGQNNFAQKDWFMNL